MTSYYAVTFAGQAATWNTLQPQISTSSSVGDRITILTTGYYVIRFFMQCFDASNFCSYGIERNSAGNVDGHFVLGDIVLANTESAPSLYGLAEFSGYLTVGDSILFRCSSNGYGGNKCATSESRERERDRGKKRHT